MPEQLGLALPSVPALGRADFLVAPSNAVATAMVEGPAADKLVLTGPSGAGKTHLAHVWATRLNATIIDANSLIENDIPKLARGPVAIEDVPQIATDPDAQTALFHLHNLVLAEGHRLLFTGRGVVRDWGITLPDLASRIAAAPAAALDLPDDTLLAAVLAKLFADRQVTPKPDLIPYLIARMDRSFAAAQEMVDRLDAASLAQKRPVSRPLAGRLLDKEPPRAR
ncbi:chromosomal replication initiator DnaA [Roseobacter sp.]|uniref:HdaA/DnaA family protein n=1 Tax=Roseobacter sp. TaxID=1907202 RepID=UPI0032996931